ncbi:MAG: HupE/UreJ family protein [Candidatus Contendobacter sp.]|nr:HupE/UreJ family protein [Candidatus Contendobacter sp.]MDG4558922.1 HupE/UreJ family protein [Candidatus Contendobacter sp.]
MLTRIFGIIPSTLRRGSLVHLAWCVVVVALLSGAAARAHEIGTTRVSVLFQEDRTYGVQIVTDAVALAEKLKAVAGGSPLDTCAACLQSAFISLEESFRQRVKLAFDGREVRPAISHAITPGADAISPTVVTFRLTGPIPPNAGRFTWSYGWTFASYALTIQGAEPAEATTEWLEGGQTSAPFTLAAPTPPVDRLGTAWRYLGLGFTHILPLGFDHILFLLALLLPAVLWWENGRWRPATTLRTVLLETTGIVTAFTLAHSLTLSLAVLGVVNLPSRLVESVIALTVLLAALNNLFPVVTTRRWSLAFVLGLIHGFGFASALWDLGLPTDALALALASFNLGVETGQLTIVAVVLPLAFALRQTWLYRRLALPVGSTAVALLALVWCLERGLNINLFANPT